jgi:hypothetical protein
VDEHGYTKSMSFVNPCSDLLALVIHTYDCEHDCNTADDPNDNADNFSGRQPGIDCCIEAGPKGSTLAQTSGCRDDAMHNARHTRRGLGLASQQSCELNSRWHRLTGAPQLMLHC